MEFLFDPILKEAAPGYRLIAIMADVTNGPTCHDAWLLLEQEGERVRQTWQMPEINKRPAIAATRAAYKVLGKEPNRYRPSAEALCRRMVKGMELYRTLTLIDLINLISVRSGYSIGGFDADKISGDTLTLGVGRAGEDFEAIGRGQLNIEGLPVFRDAVGGIGTPTSDNERTKLSPDTRRLLMTVNIYGQEMPDAELIDLTTGLLTRFADAKNIEVKTILP